MKRSNSMSNMVPVLSPLDEEERLFTISGLEYEVALMPKSSSEGRFSLVSPAETSPSRSERLPPITFLSSDSSLHRRSTSSADQQSPCAFIADEYSFLDSPGIPLIDEEDEHPVVRKTSTSQPNLNGLEFDFSLLPTSPPPLTRTNAGGSVVWLCSSSTVGSPPAPVDMVESATASQGCESQQPPQEHHPTQTHTHSQFSFDAESSSSDVTASPGAERRHSFGDKGLASPSPDLVDKRSRSMGGLLDDVDKENRISARSDDVNEKSENSNIAKNEHLEVAEAIVRATVAAVPVETVVAVADRAEVHSTVTSPSFADSRQELSLLDQLTKSTSSLPLFSHDSSSSAVEDISADAIFEYVEKGVSPSPTMPLPQHPVTRRRRQESLPDISERSEVSEAVLPSPGDQLEPDEYAPAYPLGDDDDEYADERRDCCVAPPPLPPTIAHRRAISDHAGMQQMRQMQQQHMERTMQRAREMDEDPNLPIRTRSVHGRGSGTAAARCLSHQMAERGGGHQPLDRHLSNSDPALEDRGQVSSSNGSPVALEPPPVVLSRKGSYVQKNKQSWKEHLPPGPFGAHTVFSPSLPSRQLSPRPEVDPAPSAASTISAKPGTRVEKKPKSGGMVDHLASMFSSTRAAKKKSKPDRSLDSVIGAFAARSGGVPPPQTPTPATTPVAGIGPRRMTTDGILPAAGLPDHLYNVFTEDVAAAAERLRAEQETDEKEAWSAERDLRSPMWDRLCIFDEEEYSTWHEKYRSDHLSEKQRKLQDSIYELICQERIHCAHLVFLKKAYRVRLLEEGIVAAADMERLVPDVLEAMLLFHINLLDRLQQRQRESDQVETITDILAHELGEAGAHSQVAINAYTTFGAMKERAEVVYKELIYRNARFANFIKKRAEEPMYKRYEFKTLLNLIIGRPTKYQLMIDTMAKYESACGGVSASTEAASLSARYFASRIDHGLSVSHMVRAWKDACSQLDPATKTTIYLLAENDATMAVPFGVRDLNGDGSPDSQRRILCIGDVVMKQLKNNQNAGSQTMGKWVAEQRQQRRVDILLILFDDILVCLQKKSSNGKMAFLPQGQSVFPVNVLHLRDLERSKSLLLISRGEPILMEIEFRNKPDKLKWTRSLEAAIANAPKKVRLSKKSEESISSKIRKEREAEQSRRRKEEAEWMKRLNEMFDARTAEESRVAEWVLQRMQWFDELRAHIASSPFAARGEVPADIRQAVQHRFRDLKAARTTPLNKLVDLCTMERDQDLWNYFDDRAELALAEEDDCSSDSSRAGASGGGQLPRRINTFHGTGAGKDANKPLSMRRHTTVPKLTSPREAEVEKEEEEESGREIVLDRSSDSETEQQVEEEEGQREQRKRRRASSRLVRRVVEMRRDAEMLKHQNALNVIRISMLESAAAREQAMSAPAAESRTVEALRKKEQELRELESSLRVQQMSMESEREQMQQMAARQEEAERELAEKWRVLAVQQQQRGGTGATETTPTGQRLAHAPSMRSASEARTSPMQQSIGMSPALKNLKKETKMKKK